MMLVCGATGLLGERVTRRLAARGVPLRLLLRGDAIAQELGAEVVRGDWPHGRVIVFGRGETIARYVAADGVALGIEPRSVTAYAAQVTRDA
jgi:nucleoside-diphosphate-sugar epimerase